MASQSISSERKHEQNRKTGFLSKSLAFFQMFRRSYKIASLLAFVALFSFSLKAQTVSLEDVEAAAGSFLITKNIERSFDVAEAHLLYSRNNDSLVLAYLINLEPGGFLIFSADTRLTPVISYSFTSDNIRNLEENNPLINMIIRDMMLRLDAIDHGIKEQDVIDSNTSRWEELIMGNVFFERSDITYPPQGSTNSEGWTETQWGQSGIFNQSCPIDPVTNNRTVTGCVATAMGQIVNYWGEITEMPNSVVFNNSDSYTSSFDPGDGNGTRVIDINAPAANINDLSFPLSNDQIADLLYACGVSVNMKYSDAASSTHTYRVRSALLDKFSFAGGRELSPSNNNFYDILANNMINALPAQLAVRTTDQGGNHSHHSIVCDGYNETEQTFRLNFGWQGNGDGWYSLPQDMPFDYNVVKYGILNIVNELGGINEISANLLLDQQGVVNIDVKAPRDGTFRIKVVHLNGWTSPNWNWESNTSEQIELLAGEEHTFQLFVTPDDVSEGFVFKMGRKNLIGYFYEIDRLEEYLYTQNLEKKNITEILAYDLEINKNSNVFLRFIPPDEGEYRIKMTQTSDEPEWVFNKYSSAIDVDKSSEELIEIPIVPKDGHSKIEFQVQKKQAWGIYWRNIGSSVEQTFYARNKHQNARPPYPILLIHGWAGNKNSWEHERHEAGNWIDYFTNLGWNFGGIIPFTLEANTSTLHDEAYSDILFLNEQADLLDGDFYSIDFDYHRDGGHQPGVNFRFKNISDETDIIELHWNPFYTNDPYQIKVGDLLVTGVGEERECMKVLEAYHANGAYKVIRGYENTKTLEHISELDEKGQEKGVSVTNHSSLSNQASLVKQGIAVKMAIEKIKELTGAEKVVLLCHSMGGLAARQYVQNSDIFDNDVAKIVTISTPHLGSNTSDLSSSGVSFFQKFNINSDAVRDLRYSVNDVGSSAPSPPYPNETDNSPALFGNDENVEWAGIFNWFSYDIDGDGIEGSNTITGLNQKDWPEDVLIHALQFRRPGYYGNQVLGDDIVRFDRQAPTYVDIPDNNVETSEIVMNPFYVGDFNRLILHQVSRYQIDKIMIGMDEPDHHHLAYEVPINLEHKLHGFITPKSDGTLQDIDWYKFQASKTGLAKVGIQGIDVFSSNWSLNIYNEEEIALGYELNQNSTIEEITFPVNEDIYYYIKIEATATDDSYLTPYTFSIEEVGLDVTIIEPQLGYPVIVDVFNINQSDFDVIIEVKNEEGQIIHNLTPDNFSAFVGNLESEVEDFNQNNGLYTLTIAPPNLSELGLYDLKINVEYEDFCGNANLSASVLYTNQALIEKGINWLRSQQNESSGYWSGYSTDRVGATALALQVFLAAGYSPQKDAAVSNGINYLLSQTQSNGGIYNRLSSAGYQCAMAITALRSAARYNPPNIHEINQAVINAQNYYIINQSSQGGWRYRPHQENTYDLSVSQWVYIALEGVENQSLWDNVLTNLHNHCRHSSGGYRYRSTSSPTGTMTCAGIWGELIAGGNLSYVDEGFNWLKNNFGGNTQGIVNAYHNHQWTYYYLYNLAKAAALAGKTQLFGENWYELIYNRIENLQQSNKHKAEESNIEISHAPISPGEMEEDISNMQFFKMSPRINIDKSNDMTYWTNNSSSYENNVLSTAFALLSLQVGTVPPGSKISISLNISEVKQTENIEFIINDHSGNMAGLIDNEWFTNIPFSEWVSTENGYYELEVYIRAASNFTTQIMNHSIDKQLVDLSFKAYLEDALADEENFSFEIEPLSNIGASAYINAIGGLNVIITSPPAPMPVMQLDPSTIAFDTFEYTQTYNFSFEVKETGGESPLENIDIFASALIDNMGNTIPASNFTFSPNNIAEVPAGGSVTVDATLVTPDSFDENFYGIFQGLITAQTSQQARAITFSLGSCLPPVNLQAQVAGDGQTVSLSWQAPANSGRTRNKEEIVFSRSDEPGMFGESTADTLFMDGLNRMNFRYSNHSPGAKTDSPEDDKGQVVLNYDGPNYGAVRRSGGGILYAAVRFPSSMVENYAGYRIEDVKLYIADMPSGPAEILIWGQGTADQPGALLHQQPFVPVEESWIIVELNDNLVLADEDIWVGYAVTDNTGQYPAGVDAGPPHPDGNWVSIDGEEWEKLTDHNINSNLNIRAGLSATQDQPNPVSYNIYRNNELIANVSASTFSYIIDAPGSGVFNYSVSAVYDHCESDQAGPVQIIFYSLDINANPPNEGTVNGAGNYIEGQTVNISANAAPGFEFVNWTGDILHLADPSSPATSLVMPAQNVNLTANFQPIPPDLFTLTLVPHPAAGGTATGGGQFEAGTVVPVNAIANAGWEFVEWKQNGVQVSDVPNFNFIMPAENVTLHAHFIEEELPPQNFLVTYNVVGANGTLSAFVDDNPIASGEMVEAGKTVEFVAEPDEGYQVKEWKRNGIVIFGYTAENYTIYNLSQNITVTVEFEETPHPSHVVDFHVEGGNGILHASVDGTAIASGDDVEEGKTVVFEAQPDEGYQVKQWTLNGSIITQHTEQTYTLSNLSENITVTVEFEELPPNTYVVNFHVVGGNGILSASVDGNPITSGDAVEEGKTVVFEAQPDEGYQVKQWKRNGMLIHSYTALIYTFSNLSINITVTVEFEAIAGMPELSAEPQLLEFDNVLIGECDQKSYLLTGENLTANINVNAPAGFLVSTNANMGYSESILVEHTNGIVNQTIYVQFCPMAEQTYSGNITNTSGETSAIVFVSGNGYDEITEDSNIMKVHDAIAQINGIVTIELEIINDNEFVGFNLDIPLPEGFNYIDGSAQIYRDNGHVFNFGILSGNIARMISFSIFNTPFSGNSGVIVSFDVQAPEVEGNYVFEIADDAVIADANSNNIITGTIPGTITLTDSNMVVFNITDINGVVIDDATITLGNHTNEPGDYVFEDVIDGTYNYMVEKSCHITKEGQLNVTGGNQQVDVILYNLPGDANGDGVVNVSDLVIMSNYFMGEDPQPFCFINADINGDGVVNVQDIVGVSNIFMEGKFQPFPHIESKEAHFYLFKDGIYLESDGTITGLQFNLNGSMLNDINLSITLPDHDLLFKHESNVLTALLFSLNNTAIPKGKIKIIDFANAGETPLWGDDIVLANINADYVPVTLHYDELTNIQEFAGILDFKIYPNPSEGVVQIEFLNQLDQQIDLSLFNLHGQIITSKLINETGHQHIKFEINDIPAGIYFIKLQSNSNNIIEKIVFK